MSKKRKPRQAAGETATRKNADKEMVTESVDAESDMTNRVVDPPGVPRRKALLILSAILLATWIGYLAYVAWVVNQ